MFASIPTDWLYALLGGVLIGLSATLLLLSHGRVAGISGIVGGLLMRHTTLRLYRVAFIAGLAIAALLLLTFRPWSFVPQSHASLLPVAIGGLLVGFGTRLGNGCTSGHGVCGISRMSVRSLAATLTFIATGAGAVFALRHLFGGAS